MNLSIKDMYSMTTSIQGCLLFNKTRENGYGYFCINGRVLGAHRVMWQLLYGKIPDGKYVCHTCDHRSCIKPNHLFLGTAKENMQDASRKGRTPRGEKQGRSKLTWGQVAEIRGLKDILPQSEIAIKFNVSQMTVSHIHRGNTWRLL
jgi:hypothetical protein